MMIHCPPCGGKRLPLLYWMHPGGFALLGPEDGTGLMAATELLQRGVPVVLATVDYRLAPEHPFPAGFEDCLRGLLWLLHTPEAAQAYGYEPTCVHVAGLSSGGGLAAAVANAMARRTSSSPLSIRSVLVGQPMLDPACNTDSYANHGGPDASWLRLCWDMYLDGTDLATARGDWRCCPHLHPPPRGSLPPQLVVTSLEDPLRDEGREYVRSLRAAGCDVTHMEGQGSHVLGLEFSPDSQNLMFRSWSKLLQAPPCPECCEDGEYFAI